MTPRETAEKIVRDFERDCEESLTQPGEMANRIAAAMTIPANHVRIPTSEGWEDVKVLGILQRTDDGCIIGDKCELWYALPKGSVHHVASMDHAMYFQPYPVFSSESAALASREKGKM